MKALALDAWYSLRARRASLGLSLLGLTLAQAAALLVGLLALALAAVAPGITDPARVVMLDFKGNPPGRPGPWANGSPVIFGPLLKAQQAPLDLISRVGFDGIDLQVQGRQEPAFLLLMDPDTVPLLGLLALHGDLRQSLLRHDGIAITRDLVRRVWGELPLAQALGRTLESRGVLYTVTAVLPDVDPRLPLGEANPMVGRAWAVVGFESQGNRWTADERQAIFMVNGRVFARLRPGGTADAVGGWMRQAFVSSPGFSKLPAEWTTQREAAHFRAVPLTQLPFEGEVAGLRWGLIGAVGAASALLLLMAAFNHMNLQAAGLLQRQRETALRRSLGADDRQLLRLWALEALLPLLLSAAGALLLAWWVAPAVAQWMDLSPALPVADPVPLAAWAGLAASVLLLWPLTLALPAGMALRRAPVPALQGRTASEGPWGRRIRQGLLTLQLSGALLLLSLAAVLALQQRHLVQLERGFDTRNRLWLGVMADPQRLPPMEAFIHALNRHPAVLHWAFSSGRPGVDTDGPKELHISASQQQQVLRVSTVSSGFIDTYGLKLLAGSLQTGVAEPRLVIDAKAARQLGFASPQAAVGALLRGGGSFLQAGDVQRRVVAVVADVKLESAREPALPQAFVVDDKVQWDLTVHGKDAAQLREAVSDLWRAHGPAVPHQVRASDELLADAYRQEQQLTTLLITVALMAMGVAVVGAYALAADSLRRRRTELVLRRLHGAGPSDIVRSVAAEFIAPMALAALLALPLAAWLAQAYLADFVDRIEPPAALALALPGALGLTLLVLVLATARHVRQGLSLQPIEALG